VYPFIEKKVRDIPQSFPLLFGKRSFSNNRFLGETELFVINHDKLAKIFTSWFREKYRINGASYFLTAQTYFLRLIENVSLGEKES